MADVTMKICDRCKKEIKDRRGIAVYEPVFIRSILSIALFRKSLLGFSDLFQENKFDLCEDCSNKLVRFLNGAELELDVNEELDKVIEECE